MLSVGNKMRRLRKQPIAQYDVDKWNQRNVGDRVYYLIKSPTAWMYDIFDYRDNADFLNYRLVCKNGKPRAAERDAAGIWYWRD